MGFFEISRFSFFEIATYSDWFDPGHCSVQAAQQLMKVLFAVSTLATCLFPLASGIYIESYSARGKVITVDPTLGPILAGPFTSRNINSELTFDVFNQTLSHTYVGCTNSSLASPWNYGAVTSKQTEEEIKLTISSCGRQAVKQGFKFISLDKAGNCLASDIAPTLVISRERALGAPICMEYDSFLVLHINYIGPMAPLVTNTKIYDVANRFRLIGTQASVNFGGETEFIIQPSPVDPTRSDLIMLQSRKNLAKYVVAESGKIVVRAADTTTTFNSRATFLMYDRITSTGFTPSFKLYSTAAIAAGMNALVTAFQRSTISPPSPPAFSFSG